MVQLPQVPTRMPHPLCQRRLSLPALHSCDLLITGGIGALAAVIAAQKIKMRLGGDANLAEPFPYKPRTMHWAKYRKLEARYNRLVECVAAGFYSRNRSAMCGAGAAA